MHFTRRVALLWTFYKVILSFLYCGDHTCVAYSIWGRTIDLYRFKNISLSMYVKLMNIIPRFLFAIFTFFVMWSRKLSYSSINTPRSFYDSTLLIVFLLSPEPISYLLASVFSPI